MNRFICIHAHFYQPPRENPWTGEIEYQKSAYPYSNWNERITAECYAPNTASRILNPSGKIINIINNYTRISFDFGPTLLSWMEKNEPETYRNIIAADKISQKYFSGHGSAIAQAYNHIIMPLANSQDKQTQVIWGIKDFEYRFGRKPEGMWLPETAVDMETLEILAAHDIKFTILAPHQARCIRKINERQWIDVRGGKINTKMPYLLKLPSKKTISLFFYDSSISNEVAFGGILNNGEYFAQRLVNNFSNQSTEPQITHIATDGETYGHHRRFGDMALSYCLNQIEKNQFVKLTIYAEFLTKFPPTHEVRIFENSSWSCLHGVERWRDNCGCRLGTNPGWVQNWRAPLREAMDWLRDNLINIYEKQISSLVRNPWQARDDYITIILNRTHQNIEDFLSRHKKRELSSEDKIKILKLLEMQRNAMLMYTSCGWFFDDISGIEAIQIMRYAARAMELAREVSGKDLEPTYLQFLEEAKSNLPQFANGARIYEMFVKPDILSFRDIARHYLVNSLFKKYQKKTNIYFYTVDKLDYKYAENKEQKIATGRILVRSNITQEEKTNTFIISYLGDCKLFGRLYEGSTTPDNLYLDFTKALLDNNHSQISQLINKHTDLNDFSFDNLPKDTLQEVANYFLKNMLTKLEVTLEGLNRNFYTLAQAIREKELPITHIFNSIIQLLLNLRLHVLSENKGFDLAQLQRILNEANKWHLELDKSALSNIATNNLNRLMKKLYHSPYDISILREVEDALQDLKDIKLEVNTWKAQNIYFTIKKRISRGMKQKNKRRNQNTTLWLKYFSKLGDQLGIETE